MRVVVLGAGGAHRTEMSIVRALRQLGHHCRLFDIPVWHRWLGPLMPRVVRRAAEAFSPDAVILTRKALALGSPTIQALTDGRAGGLWFFDWSSPLSPDIVALGRAAGTMFITCYSQLAQYRAAGVPQVHYLPQAADPVVDRPAATSRAEYHCDFSFVGSGQYRYRHALLRRLAASGRLQIRGYGWDQVDDLPIAGGPVHGAAFAEVTHGAAISIGAYATPEQSCECACASNRIWKVLACGGFFLGQWQAGADGFARHGEHCAWYRTDEEAVALAQYYLARPAERRSIAEEGRAHVLREHTYVHRLPLLLANQGFSVEPFHTIV